MIQREVFIQHLKNWALNHDSSAYFHGKIRLSPQSVSLGEVVELGKSVSCILTDSSPANMKRIVIRLFKSHYHSSVVRHREKEQNDHIVSYYSIANQISPSVEQNESGHDRSRAQQDHSIAPYKLVIRSGSGWVPAREYLDKHYFTYPRKRDVQAIPQAWPELTTNNANGNSNFLPDATDQAVPPRTQSKHVGALFYNKETVTISPLFRPFLRLPPELQDEILYEAIGYTRCVRLTRKDTALGTPDVSKPPTTISKLFRISKAINEHMTEHIFRSTNFHFGVTGFTNFLWQLGPINRPRLQHLTFHFGKVSLLHCIRWLAPDPIYELFEPPVATNPANLTYFWRCQLQDLMKELNLLTFTIDTKDVPGRDVPMLVRILGSTIGSVNQIKVINTEFSDVGELVEVFPKALSPNFKCMPNMTWRESSVAYFEDYRHQKWSMRNVWQIPGADLFPLLHIWMDKEKAFFDS